MPIQLNALLSIVRKAAVERLYRRSIHCRNRIHGMQLGKLTSTAFSQIVSLRNRRPGYNNIVRDKYIYLLDTNFISTNFKVSEITGILETAE